VWRSANRAADRTLVTIVTGAPGAAKVSGGEVTLEFRSIGANMTNQFGLPDIGSKLPPSVANLVILKSNQIKFIQNVGGGAQGLALVLTIIVPLMYAVAVFLARGPPPVADDPGDRDRGGWPWSSVAARRIVGSGVVDSRVKVEADKPAVSSVVSIATSMFGEIAGAFVFVGVPLILAAWFACLARLVVRMRRAIPLPA
jgi:hypothetical protein